MVSGSGDQTTKIWSLTSGKLLKTLDQFSHWVVHLVLKDATQHHLDRYANKNILIAMTKDFLTFFSWHNIEDLSERSWDYQIPLNPTDCFIWKKVFFTPGMQLYGQKIAFVRQVAMFDTHTVGDADLIIADANTGQVVKSIHINQKIRKLLAVGEKYALILLPFVNSRYQNLAIVDLDQRKIIGGCTVPHSRANNPDFTQVTTGHLKWLDGFDGTPSQDLMVGLSTVENSMYLVYWNITE